MTNYFCALLLFDYLRDMDHESAANKKLINQSGVFCFSIWGFEG